MGAQQREGQTPEQRQARGWGAVAHAAGRTQGQRQRFGAGTGHALDSWERGREAGEKNHLFVAGAVIFLETLASHVSHHGAQGTKARHREERL